MQIASVQEALRAVGRARLRNHLRHCVSHAVGQGPEQADATFDELVHLFDRYSRCERILKAGKSMRGRHPAAGG